MSSCCHRCGVGSIPGLGTSACHGCGQKMPVKKHSSVIALCEVARVIRLRETDIRRVAAEAGGGRNGESVFSGYTVSDLQDKRRSGDGWW